MNSLYGYGLHLLAEAGRIENMGRKFRGGEAMKNQAWWALLAAGLVLVFASTKLAADMRGAKFTKSNLEQAQFLRANGQEMQMNGVNLRGANLSDATFDGTNFDRAFLVEAITEGSMGMPGWAARRSRIIASESPRETRSARRMRDGTRATKPSRTATSRGTTCWWMAPSTRPMWLRSISSRIPAVRR